MKPVYLRTLRRALDIAIREARQLYEGNPDAVHIVVALRKALEEVNLFEIRTKL